MGHQATLFGWPEATDVLTIKWDHQRVARGDQRPVALLVLGKELRFCKNLLAASSDGDALRNKSPANGRLEAIHRKMRSRYIASFSDGCETARGVQQSCNHARMKMACILSKIVAPLHDNFGRPACCGGDLEPRQTIQSSRG